MSNYFFLREIIFFYKKIDFFDNELYLQILAQKNVVSNFDLFKNWNFELQSNLLWVGAASGLSLCCSLNFEQNKRT